MIEQLKITGPKKPPITWWSKPFPRKRVFKFKSGLNVLWGPNGSGKSTIIKALAFSTHCIQSGVSVVTQKSVDQLLGFFPFEEDKEGPGVSLCHDGKSVVYFDPSNLVGLDGSHFDYDFLSEGVANMQDKGSTGQQAARRFSYLFRKAQESSEEIVWNITEHGVNKVWKKKLQKVKSYLEPNIDTGVPTVLMDEPDAVLDWPTKAPLWEWIEEEGKNNRVQFIIATHSIFGLKLMQLKNTNTIELVKGYRKKCEDVLHASGFWKE